MKTSPFLASICLITIFASSHSFAQSAWVSDEFEITLRSGPSTSNAIQLMLSSGSELQVLERDAESGYTRVRTSGGTEGWVLTRYLMNEPSAREQLQTLTGQLTSANTRGTSLDSQLSAIRGEYDAAEDQIASLGQDNERLTNELADIRRTAANVLAVNDDNSSLRKQLNDSELKVDVLEQENRQLRSQSTRYWFMSGGLLIVVGIVLGLWLPRMKWRRSSRYDRF
jgi:SH3 domain protein